MRIKLIKPEQRIKIWHITQNLALSSLILLSVISCVKEADANLADEYYVKYEVNSSTIYFGAKLDFTIRTEENEDLTLVIDQRALHETIIGPVKKGFNASMVVTAQGNTHEKLKLYASIYVSKNGSPFSLKRTDGSEEPRDFVQLSYTIDY